MYFKEFYHSGLYHQIIRHMVDPDILMKHGLFYLVDEVNIGKNVVQDCCYWGHFELLKRVSDRSLFNMQSCYQAFTNGHFKIIKFLFEENLIDFKDFRDAWSGAAEGGHLHIIKYLHTNNIAGCTTRAMDIAAIKGRLDVVQFLYYNRTEGCTKDAIDLAAYYWKIDVVKFLLGKPQPHGKGIITGTERAIDLAAQAGCFELVKYFFDNGLKTHTNAAMDYAAAGGHFEILKFLHENSDIGFSSSAIKWAAGNNRYEIVKYLLEINKDLIRFPALSNCCMNGNDDILILLLDNYPHITQDYIDELISIAQEFQHESIVDYLISRFR